MKKCEINQECKNYLNRGKKIQVNIRQYINKKYIQSNSNIVDEMIYRNRVYGRSNSIIKRGMLVFKLYFKYAILKNDFASEMERMKSSMKYPESFDNQKVQILDIQKRSRYFEEVYIDIWNVLLYLGLDMNQIYALTETKEHNIGLSDVYKLELPLDKNTQNQIDNIIYDFTVVNTRLISLIKDLCKNNRKVKFINNSEVPNTLVKKKIEEYGLKVEFCMQQADEVLHITNNCQSNNDVAYKNVNWLGEKYRPYIDTNIVTTFYNQLVNMRFHSSEKTYSIFYEYGYSCGGILICGFCQFLEKLAKQEDIDKFLFVARDGDIMHQVYKRYFNHVDSSYLLFSRFASYELIFEDFPSEYIDKNIRTRIERKGTDNSIKKILSECGLECLGKYLSEENLEEGQILTNDNYVSFRRVILHHKEEIQNSFQETCEAAKKYFMKEIQGKKKVCIVDLGWHGKSIVYMKHLCEKKYEWKGSIVGAMIGASESQIVQSHIRTRLIHTYAFENEYWRNLGTHCGKHMGYKECICLEELFSSPSDTLLRYKLNQEGGTDFIYGKKNKNKKTIEEIHRGILDFAEQFMPIIQKYNLFITPRDAYTPTDAAMRNQNYVNMLYEKYDEEPNAINGF